MVSPAVDAAVQSALANQQFDTIAAVLDAAELEVGNTAHQLLKSDDQASSSFCVLHVFVVSQSSNPNVLLQWPHALHMLGLIYNQQL